MSNDTLGVFATEAESLINSHSWASPQAFDKWITVTLIKGLWSQINDNGAVISGVQL